MDGCKKIRTIGICFTATDLKLMQLLVLKSEGFNTKNLKIFTVHNECFLADLGSCYQILVFRNLVCPCIKARTSPYSKQHLLCNTCPVLIPGYW